MDPNTSTREEFTTGLTAVPLPPVPLAPEWKELAEQLRTLLNKLAYHPAMAPNLQQTYMTPAASKNNVYFMWDFVGRTLVRSVPSPHPHTHKTSLTRREGEKIRGGLIS